MRRNPSARKRTSPLVVFLGTLVASLTGYFLPQFIRYFQKLYRQPGLPARTAAEPNAATPSLQLIEQARTLAAENLRAGIETRRLPNGEEKLIVCAGVRNFREPWARDFGFASFGLLELGEARAVRECLEVFLLTQNASGQFPVKVHSTSVLNRYLHSLFEREQPTNTPLRPKYITAHNTISLDGNGLLVIALLHYAAITGDHTFARTHWLALEKAMSWLETHAPEEDGLLSQGAFADWADTIARQGKVLYTNVIYWKALDEMAAAAGRYGKTEAHIRFTARAARLAEAINRHFWRPDLGYFITSQVFDNLSSSGNLLAIAWGLATPQQAHAILDAMRFYDMASPVPTQAVHRAYPGKFIALESRLGGITQYHTHFAWLWLGAWHVIALTHMGRLEEARELIYRMSRVIVRDGAVHEVYAPNGRFASNLWYTSEAPLTWSAGMYVYASQVYRRHTGKDPNNAR